LGKEITMDANQQTTPASLQTEVAETDEITPQRHDPRLIPSAPEVYYPPEKVVSPTTPTNGQSPLLANQQQHQSTYWAHGEYEARPPQYSGAPGAVLGYPPALVVPSAEAAGPEERICGIRRGLFLLLLAVGGMVLMGIAIGVGVGVGLGNQSRNNVNAAPATYVVQPPK
jgi:hypothetical protein